VAAALVDAGRVYQEEQDLFPWAAKEPALLCSGGFMGMVAQGFMAIVGQGPDLV